MHTHKNVYLIHNPLFGLTKIGISNNVKVRLNSLESSCGVSLELFYYTLPCDNSEIIEKEMHETFKNDKAKGEWFYTDKEILKEELLRKKLIIPTFVSMFLKGMSINKIASINDVSRQYIQKLLKQSLVINKKNNISEITEDSVNIRLNDDEVQNKDVYINSKFSKEYLAEIVRKNEEKLKLKTGKNFVRVNN